MLKKLRKNKKGLFSDVILVMMAIFLLSVVALIIGRVWYSSSEAFQSLDESIADNYTKAELKKIDNLVYLPAKILVWVFLFLWVGLILASLGLPVEHPAFFFIYIIFTLGVTFLSMVLQYVGVVIFSQDAFSVVLGTYSKIAFLMQNYHWVTLFLCLSAGGIFYMRLNATGGQNVIQQ